VKRFISHYLYMKLLVVPANELDEKLMNSDRAFVRFHSPQCGHCRDMHKSWENVADSAPEGLDVIDVDVSSGVSSINHECAKKMIDSGGGVPRLYLIENGNIEEYEGSRTTNEMLEFAKKQKGGRKKTRTTKRNTKRKQKSNKTRKSRKPSKSRKPRKSRKYRKSRK
jgi:thiol-disulfide isomerase/thioredoxin